MRIALVSPYSWTYPGGVTRHIEALAERYLSEGHHVRVLAPFDPPDLAASVLHRGARPQPAVAPDYLVSLGRTVGLKANGSVSNLSLTPEGTMKLRHELSTGGYDVAHIHEPVAPLVGWVAALQPRLPLVGTFHSYSTKWLPNAVANGFGASQVLNHLHVRIAVSEAAAWTGRRWYGGRYRVIPNGVHLTSENGNGLPSWRRDKRFRIAFVGQSVERKGLPVLLRAFEALREQVDTDLIVIGPTHDELAPLLIDSTGVRALGKVDDERKHAELRAADVLCAPSLGGESFGMVLTEAFAAGTTVVASDIAGYRDVVSDGGDGVLVPPGDAQALAEALRDLHAEPDRRRALAAQAAVNVERFAWERVAGQVMESYTDAIAMAEASRGSQPVAVRLGLAPADRQPKVAATRLPSLEYKHAVEESRRRKAVRVIRRTGVVAISLAGVYLAYLALRKIGIGNITSALIDSSPTFVLLGLATMCLSMVMRAFSWHAILKSALPRARIRLRDAIQGTMIGVLMSATLPARLGEPARALAVARRTGRPRDNLPIVLGTLVSQTLINLVALAILAAIMFTSVDFFSGHESALIAVAVAPAALLALLLAGPVVLRHGSVATRFERLRRALAQATALLRRVQAGLLVFRDPRRGLFATVTQLAAWGIQALSCYLLLVALGLAGRTGFAAAAAVLFAVNITAVLPATPANLGVFQAACATVLSAGWHVGFATGVAYGVILQAVEVATAILLGTPALLNEGMSWREVRLRAMHATPVKLSPRRAHAGSRRRLVERREAETQH